MFPRSCSGHLYEVLEVERDADLTAIRRQYKKLALRYHPDRNNGTTNDKFQEIEEAHRILADPDQRSLYNFLGRENMKRAGDTGFLNQAKLRPLIAGVTAMFGAVMIALWVACWRFDREFALRNAGRRASWSWWWLTLPVAPPALLMGAAATFHCKTVEGLLSAIPLFPLCAAPLSLLVITTLLSGQLSPTIAILYLFCNLLCIWLGDWIRLQTADLTTDEEGPGNAGSKLGRTVGLWCVFIFLSLIRVHQDRQSCLSMWLVALPLIVKEVWSLSSNGFQAAVKLYYLLFWTQKLNAEINNRSGYDPRAITATFPLLALATILFAGLFAGTEDDIDHNRDFAKMFDDMQANYFFWPSKSRVKYPSTFLPVQSHSKMQDVRAERVFKEVVPSETCMAAPSGGSLEICIIQFLQGSGMAGIQGAETINSILL
eukprot:gene9109-6400_t